MAMMWSRVCVAVLCLHSCPSAARPDGLVLNTDMLDGMPNATHVPAAVDWVLVRQAIVSILDDDDEDLGAKLVRRCPLAFGTRT